MSDILTRLTDSDPRINQYDPSGVLFAVGDMEGSVYQTTDGRYHVEMDGFSAEQADQIMKIVQTALGESTD